MKPAAEPSTSPSSASPPTAEAATAAYEPAAAGEAGKVAEATQKGLSAARREVRQQPWAALGAACAAGIALGFFVKR